MSLEPIANSDNSRLLKEHFPLIAFMIHVIKGRKTTPYVHLFLNSQSFWFVFDPLRALTTHLIDHST